MRHRFPDYLCTKYVEAQFTNIQCFRGEDINDLLIIFVTLFIVSMMYPMARLKGSSLEYRKSSCIDGK